MTDSIKICTNYLEYCRKVSFEGKSNRSKTLILYVLERKPGSTSKEVAYLLRKTLTLAAVRMALVRMFYKNKSIWISTPDKQRDAHYCLLAKGHRFLYLVRSLHPEKLNQWLAEAGLQ